MTIFENCPTFWRSHLEMANGKSAIESIIILQRDQLRTRHEVAKRLVQHGNERNAVPNGI